MSKNFTLRFDEEQLNKLKKIDENKGLTFKYIYKNENARRIS